MAALQCDICGGKLMGKPGGIFECDSCGMEYSTEWAKAKIQEIKGTVKVEGTVEVKGTVRVEGSANIEGLLKRGQMALEDKCWSKAEQVFDQILGIEPENAQAHLGLCMARKKIPNINRLKLEYKALSLEEDKSFRRAKQYAKGETAELFQSLVQKGSQKFVMRRPIMRGDLEEKRLIVDKVKHLADGRGNFDGMADHNLFLWMDGTVTSCEYSSAWNNVIAISGSSGLRENGTVVNKYSQNTAQWKNIVAISQADKYLMGLRADGTVVTTDQDPEVRKWRNIVGICAGEHKFGIRNDGTVVVSITGTDKTGEANVQDWKEIVALDTYKGTTVGLKADGTVIATGYNHYGQCNTGFMEDIVDVALSKFVTLGLKVDGSVVTTSFVGEGSKTYKFENPDKANQWKNVACLFPATYNPFAVDINGNVLYTGKGYVGKKLFHNPNTVMEDREKEKQRKIYEMEYTRKKMLKNAAEREVSEWEAKVSSSRQRIQDLKEDEEYLRKELANLKKFFSGKRRKEIEEKLPGFADRIETEQENLKNLEKELADAQKRLEDIEA